MRVILDSGLDPRAAFRGRSPIQWLTEMYMRSDRFPECVRLLLDRGAVLDDPALVPVLLDDADGLAAALRADPSWIRHRTSRVSAFTPLVGASLLHVAAEYGNAKAARVLVEMGADVEARAALDDFGLNGHTPLFHTVHSIDNHALPVLRLLLDAGAKTDVHVAGITWGRGFEWETTCFDVTPISYAQLGLLPQMHRRDHDVYDNIRRLLAAAGRIPPPLENVPNRYLKPKT
jgi:ankyrin repeat protein